MKVQMREIIQAIPALSKITGGDLSLRLAYQLKRNIAELQKEADFFSFGTNDLTQLVYGLSRDDTGKLIETYMEDGLFTEDPFQTLDQDGVGRLVSMAAKAGRQTRPKIKLGICGEHGGDPKTIAFCNALDLSYVSCSPSRVPVARLAAAQSVVHSEEEKEG